MVLYTKLLNSFVYICFSEVQQTVGIIVSTMEIQTESSGAAPTSSSELK